MQVVGLTNQQEVYVASKEHKFRINELLKIMDQTLDNPLGEVVQTQSYNRYIPLSVNNSFVDQGVIDSLESIGYNISEDEINIAQLRLLEEAPYPVQTGASVEIPDFTEVRDLLVKEEPEDGLVLGEVKGTEEVAQEMDDGLKDVAPLLEEEEIIAQQGIPFNFKLKAMHQYPHIGIIGGSGSGKSFGMRVILE
jgi:DNA helicase HerA-like ATPase